MTQITLDGLNLIDEASGYFVGRPLSGLEVPALSSSGYAKSGEDGFVVSGIYTRERRITINGMLKASCGEDLEVMRRLLANRAIPERDSLSRLQPKVLRIIDFGGGDYSIDVQVLGLIMPREYPTYSRYQLDLISDDFRLYSTTSKSGIATLSTGGYFSIPFEIPFSFIGGADGSVAVTNSGDTNTFVTIVFNGPLTNPRLYNEDNDSFIQLNTTINTGDYVTVNTKNKTVVGNTGNNLLSTMTDNSTWLYLSAGENVLTLTSGSGSDTGNATVTFKDAYAGL